jgi:uncharacterized surface protein with fasciclin (FAS1) repeats
MTKIEETLEASGFDTFAGALRASPYGDVLDGGGYTVFAPSNEAFAKFPSATLDRLLHGDETLMRSVLGYHFATGRVCVRLLRGKRIRAVMYAAGDVIIDGKDGLRVNGANIIKPDIEAGASIVHGIDAVLWPRAPKAALQ